MLPFFGRGPRQYWLPGQITAIDSLRLWPLRPFSAKADEFICSQNTLTPGSIPGREVPLEDPDTRITLFSCYHAA